MSLSFSILFKRVCFCLFLYIPTTHLCNVSIFVVVCVTCNLLYCTFWLALMCHRVIGVKVRVWVVAQSAVISFCWLLV